MAAPLTVPSPLLFIHVQAEELQAADPQDAIIKLANALAQRAGMADAQPLILSALQREACEPTYIGRGMAMPHARVEGASYAGVCVAHAPAGIPWQGELAQLIIFLAVPEEQPELYLQFMSRLVRWRMGLPNAVLTHRRIPAAAWEEELRTLLPR